MGCDLPFENMTLKNVAQICVHYDFHREHGSLFFCLRDLKLDLFLFKHKQKRIPWVNGFEAVDCKKRRQELGIVNLEERSDGSGEEEEAKKVSGNPLIFQWL